MLLFIFDQSFICFLLQKLFIRLCFTKNEWDPQPWPGRCSVSSFLIRCVRDGAKEGVPSSCPGLSPRQEQGPRSRRGVQGRRNHIELDFLNPTTRNMFLFEKKPAFPIRIRILEDILDSIPDPYG